MATDASPDDGDAVTTQVKKPLYEASTQFRNWRYSSEQLADIRKSLNVTAVTAIRNTFELAEVIYFQFSLLSTQRCRVSRVPLPMYHSSTQMKNCFW